MRDTDPEYELAMRNADTAKVWQLENLFEMQAEEIAFQTCLFIKLKNKMICKKAMVRFLLPSLTLISVFIIKSPLFHRLDNRSHRLAKFRNGVFYSRRDFRKYGSCNNPVRFHRSETVSQDFLADAV